MPRAGSVTTAIAAVLVGTTGLAPGAGAAVPKGCEGTRTEPVVEPATLCGETTIEGSTTGVIRVTLPTDATLYFVYGPGGSIEIDGDGRFAGFMLSEDPPSTQGYLVLAGKVPDPLTGPGPYVTQVRTPPDPSQPPQPPPPPNVPHPPVFLPAGSYLLHLIADGTPVRATFRLEGASGSTTLEPARETSSTVHLVKPTPVEHVYASGSPVTVTGTSIGFVLQEVDASVHSTTQFNACVHEGDPPVTAWLAGCNRTDGGRAYAGGAQGYTSPVPDAVRLRRQWLFSSLDPGSYLIGGSYVTASQPYAAALLALVLPVDP